jgi:aryl-alcohol dehydrogenase-like predicted oxidoreductase
MERRHLGSIEVSAIGIGCMGMTGFGGHDSVYGPADRTEAIATIHRAIDLGIDLFDTAEMYGPHDNEELLGEALVGRRDKVRISTKFGFRFQDRKIAGTDSTPANIRRAIEGSLRRLRTDHVDFYFQHRVDPAVPIEQVIETMAALKQEGKIRAIGLSEAGANTIRRAHATHKVDVLQSEYSLWERSIEEEILPVCRELGIGLMPYSPLGRGFLSGQAQRAEAMPEADFRRSDPRYQGSNFDRNMELVDAVAKVAARRGVSTAQVALAWLLHQGPDVVPIPGAKRRATLEDSAGAADLAVAQDDLAALAAAAPPGRVAGERYGSPAQMAMLRI